jgi:hypothetical protein
MESGACAIAAGDCCNLVCATVLGAAPFTTAPRRTWSHTDTHTHTHTYSHTHAHTRTSSQRDISILLEHKVSDQCKCYFNGVRASNYVFLRVSSCSCCDSGMVVLYVFPFCLGDFACIDSPEVFGEACRGGRLAREGESAFIVLSSARICCPPLCVHSSSDGLRSFLIRCFAFIPPQMCCAPRLRQQGDQAYADI